MKNYRRAIDLVTLLERGIKVVNADGLTAKEELIKIIKETKEQVDSLKILYDHLEEDYERVTEIISNFIKVYKEEICMGEEY